MNEKSIVCNLVQLSIFGGIVYGQSTLSALLYLILAVNIIHKNKISSM